MTGCRCTAHDIFNVQPTCLNCSLRTALRRSAMQIARYSQVALTSAPSSVRWAVSRIASVFTASSSCSGRVACQRSSRSCVCDVSCSYILWRAERPLHDKCCDAAYSVSRRPEQTLLVSGKSMVV